MKKNLFITMLCLLSLGIVAQKQADLKFNLESNKTYRLKSVQVDDQTSSMQGMTQQTERKTSMVISVKPLQQTPDFFIAEVKVDTMNISSTGPMPINIESKNEGDLNSSDPVTAIAAIIHRLSNSVFVMKISYTGKIMEIVNYETVLQNISEGIDKLEGQTKMIVEMQAKNMVSRDMIGGSIESNLNYLPGKKIKKGDKWTNTYTISASGLGSTITTQYELVSLDDNVAIIEGKSTILPASNEPTNMNGAMITSELEGLGEVRYEVDVNTGFIITGKTNHQVSGNMLVNAQGNSMSIPVESITEATVEALE